MASDVSSAASVRDAERAEAYLRRFAVEKNWPRLEECADVIASLRRDNEHAYTAYRELTEGRP